MTIDDETLLAYADGELEPARAEAVERMLASDPELAARLEQHRTLAARLRAAYDPVLDAPIPDRLTRTLTGGGGKVISFAEASAARAARTAPPRPWRAGLIAAGLAAALVAGMLLRPASGPLVERGGRLVAAGDLARVLDTQLSGGGEAIRVQLTFRDRTGAICRSFVGAASSGVACRRSGEWAVEALLRGEAPSGGAYRMASSGDPRLVQVIGDMISGDAFDAAQERAAKARHWTAQ
jgi:hypothetical protein